MKNIVTILQEQGFEIPEDKAQEITKAVAENYLTKAEHDKKIGKVEAERDQYKTASEDAANTLKSFEGIDPAKIKEEIDGYKSRAEKAEQAAKASTAKRERDDLIEKALDGVKFTSVYARKDIAARLRGEQNLTVQNGALIGFEDFMNLYKKSDPDAFGQANGGAKFTAPEPTTQGGAVTKESILAIKDMHERRAMMQKHHELFGL